MGKIDQFVSLGMSNKTLYLIIIIMALFIFMLQSIRDAIIRPGQIAPLRFIQAHNRHYNSETFMQQCITTIWVLAFFNRKCLFPIFVRNEVMIQSFVHMRKCD